MLVSKKRILVTGATGFIGNHLINHLVSCKKFEIIATSRDVEKARGCKWFHEVKYLECDINSSKESDLYAFFGKPDKVIHLAWDGLPNYNDLIHIEKNLTNNYLFIKNLVQNGLKDITITGTCFEYGLQDGCLSEECFTIPSTTYGLAKDSLRKFLEKLQMHIHFRLKWVRLFYVYGKGQPKKSLLGQLETAISNHEKTFNMSKGEQLRDFMHVSDVAKEIIKISLQNKIEGIYNCASGKPISVKAFVEDYIKKNNASISLNLGFYDYPEYEPMAFWADISKLKLIN